MANSHGPQLPALLGLTPKQLRFAELLAIGQPIGEAAIGAGIPDSALNGTLLLPAVQAYTRYMAHSTVRVRLAPLSVRTLERLLTDPKVPAAAQVAAVRLVWTSAGLLEPLRTDAPAAPPTANGAAPISARADGELAALRDRLELLRQALGQAAIDVSPAPQDPID